MTDVAQIGEDLAFVKQAVRRRDRRPDLFPVYVAWASYVLVGYVLLDLRPDWGGTFLALAWIPAALVAWRFRHRPTGGDEPLYTADDRRAGLHWGGGIGLAILAGLGLQFVLPHLRGPAGGQVIVVLIGVVYFLGGVHFDRRFLWLGPAMIVGGLSISAIPTLPWTCLGLLVAGGLVLPSLFKRGGARAQAAA
ncbi:MAG: hypothetical protein JWO31_785 [Phycisphaerales bacterium]|nr:hypothetical protein [Phycisphaerales bacterium]